VVRRPESATPRAGLEVTPSEAKGLMARGAALVDVREASELERASIAGACHVPLRELEERIDEIEELAEAREPVLVLCHHGQRSLRATLALQALGVNSARSVAGGIDRWSVEVDPEVPRYHSR
jgi:rhodanese-related sulfurtransferase